MTRMITKWMVMAYFALVVAAPAWAVNSVRAEVNGMVCAFCAQGIEKKLRALPQAAEVIVDLKNKVVVLELKEGATIDHHIVVEEIRNAGYDVTRIETVAQSAAEIRKQTKAAQ